MLFIVAEDKPYAIVDGTVYTCTISADGVKLGKTINKSYKGKHLLSITEVYSCYGIKYVIENGKKVSNKTLSSLVKEANKE